MSIPLRVTGTGNEKLLNSPRTIMSKNNKRIPKYCTLESLVRVYGSKSAHINVLASDLSAAKNVRVA